LIDPTIVLDEVSYKIENKLDDKLGQYMPGGYISVFIQMFGEKAEKFYKN
jgi:hypothetical protein